jgi:hypothetical protein
MIASRTAPVAFGIVAAAMLALLTACSRDKSATEPDPAPRFADGSIRFDRAPGEKGYWDLPSAASLVESGMHIEMDAQGKLKHRRDVTQVAPFQPWALALYQYRQQNDFADDPMKVCMGPGSPRQMMTTGGLRFIHDKNLQRMYMVFGGGNRNWRTIYLDGRAPPNPEEVTGTFLGLSVGHWEGDTLVVDSTGFNTRFWMSNGGLPHTEALKLTERFTRRTHDDLDYEVTIDDPRSYTRPWKAAWSLKWVPGDIQEQFCETGRDQESK